MPAIDTARSDMPYASYPRQFPAAALAAAVDGWFDAMAALYRNAPWSAGVDPRRPLFATLGSQGIRDAALHPLGRDGGRRGIAMLTGPDDHEAWLALVVAGGRPEDAPGFPRMELTFGAPSEAHPDVRLELERHDRGLGDAVPSVWVVDEAGESRPGGVDELLIIESVAAALADALEASPEDGGLLGAWQANEPAARTARTGDGEFEVELSTRPLTAEAALPPEALLDALRELGDDDGWLAESPRRHALEYRLDRRFGRSPEASGLPDGTRYWRTFAQWAASHVGHTIATLDAGGLEEVVFDLVPRKISADADYARPFIECLRALYRWLEREYALPQAQECLALLDAPDAVERLETLMGDSAGFDPAKAMVMEARAMGIDPSTPEGMARMQEVMLERFANARAHDGVGPYDDDLPDARPPLDPVVKAKRDAKRKAGRKAARKARKKNRR